MATYKELTQAVDDYQSFGEPLKNPGAVTPVAGNRQVVPDIEPSEEELFEMYGPRSIDVVRNADKLRGIVGSESYFEPALEAGWGDSRYDKRTGFTPGMDVEEARANAQPAVWKIGNGIIKGGITAATTAANTLVGTVFGAGAAAFNYNKQMWDAFTKNTGFNLGETLDAGVNNFVSEKLVDIQRWADEAVPNYRTAEERSEQYQQEWYKHVLTPNFIGDSILKNFGFTVGAIGAGAVWSKILGKAMSAKLVNDLMKGATVAAEGDAAAIQELVQAAQAIPKGAQVTVDAAKFTGNLKRAAQQINKASSKLKLYGAAFGAMGESSMEGLMAKDEYLEEQLPKLRDQYMALIQEAEEDILNSGDTNLVNEILTVDVDGNLVRQKVLTQRGESELYKRKLALQEIYDNKVNTAEQLGDRLATITYGLNFPALTGADAAVFGRILSGGWKTARTLRGVRGVAGNYRGLLSNMSEKAAIGTMATLNALKSAGVEAGQEMYQGFVSSGLQGSAGNLLTQYNDDGYDDRALSSMREWLGNIWEGGIEYLSDTKNWQEGFLGALTGLFGIPGRGYFSGQRGGVPQAVSEATEAVRGSRDAAEKLNNIVNSPEFQNRWHSYIRHLKYDNDMEDALAEDDKKKWTDASEKQLISDIMAFAEVGRLDDLKQMAESFKNKTAADADDIRDVLEGDDPSKQVVTKNKSDEEVVDSVVKRATELADAIDEYSDIYDALLTLAPANYSDKQFEELVFTAMNLKSVERRYLSMLNKDIADAEASILAVAGKGVQTDDEKQATASKIRADLEKAFSSLLPGGSNAEIRKQSKQVIDFLRGKIGNSDKNLSKVLDDMEKISNDRYELYNKYQKLLSGEAAREYEQQAETQEKKQEKNAKKQVKTEAQGYKTIDDVKVSYRDLVQQKGLATEFFQQLEELAPTSKPVQDFLELHDVNSDFLSFYQDNGLGISEDMTVAKSAERIILERMFDEAQNKGQYLDFDFNFDSFEDDGTVIPGGRVKTQLNAITGPTIAGMGGVDIIGRAYDQAVAAIKNGLEEYKKISNYVSGRKKPTSSKKKSNTGDSPTLRGMTGDKPTIAGMAGRPSQVEEGQEEEPERTGEIHKDSLGREWQVGQKAYMYKLDNEGEITPFLIGEYTIKNFYDSNGKHMMTLADANNKRILVDLDKSDVARLSPVKQEGYEPIDDDTTVVVRNQSSTGGTLETIKTTDVNDLSEEEQEEIGGDDDVTSNEEKHYYRTGMPEIDSFDARDVRRILKNRNLTLKEKLSAIFKINLKDFYLKDDAYRPTWQMLSNFLRSDAVEGEGAQNAFENTAFVANVGDQVEFRIDPKFDILDQDGKPQILVYTVKDGKSYLLNTLGHNTTRTTYENIDELRDTILAQYEKSDKSKVFVFTNEATGEPYRSTIWSKRNGIVVYDENKAPTYAKEKAIKDIPGYDPNAPIVFINKTGDQIQLSGSAYNRAYLSNLSDDEECHGNLYYLARGKNGYCIPIRLNVEHFRQESLKEDSVGYNTQTFKNIRSAIKDIAKVGSEILGSPIEDLNAANSRLSNAVKTLGRYLDIHDYIFRIMQKKDGEFVLRVWVNNNKGTGGWFNTDTLTEERLLKYVANQKLPVNIGETSNITSLVNGGIITSNAQALWAKGTDIYYYRWTGDGFEPYNKQEKISKDLPGSVEEESENSDKVDKEVVKKNMKGKKKGTGAVPTEAAPTQVAENTLEASIREQLAGKVGNSDMDSVVRGILLTVQGKNARRLLDGLRAFGATTDGEEAEKAFIKILGAATTRAERDEMRAEISKKTGIPVKDITTYEMYEYYMTRTEDSPLTSRVSNLVAYSNFVKDVLSALSGSAPRTSEQPAPVDDIKTELASVDYNTVKFENLSEPVKKVLLDSGCDEETFNMLSPEGKRSALSCLGI